MLSLVGFGTSRLVHVAVDTGSLLARASHSRGTETLMSSTLFLIFTFALSSPFRWQTLCFVSFFAKRFGEKKKSPVIIGLVNKNNDYSVKIRQHKDSSNIWKMWKWKYTWEVAACFKGILENISWSFLWGTPCKIFVSVTIYPQALSYLFISLE